MKFILLAAVLLCLSTARGTAEYAGSLDAHGAFSAAVELGTLSGGISAASGRRRHSEKCKVKVKCPAAQARDVRIVVDIDHGDVDLDVKVRK